MARNITTQAGHAPSPASPKQIVVPSRPWHAQAADRLASEAGGWLVGGLLVAGILLASLASLWDARRRGQTNPKAGR